MANFDMCWCTFLQAGLFSAALTSFIIDSKQNLSVNSKDQMVYYLQQNVAMLAQISQQISSITPQSAIPSSPPPPYPAFSPLPFDIRVNAFWFMALVFSLAAAFLAILVQQWVRVYMHVFLRYSDPLKCARLRQYLRDGCETWHMPIVAEAVPGLLHVSLFLFLVGLGDLVLNTNTIVGLSTTIPIGITGLLYIFTTVAPVVYPQSPYQNTFSGLIWHLFQKLDGRTYKDRGPDGGLKSVSANMSEAQMQLAMEETGERMARDEGAIRWLIDTLTEEAEIDLFVAAIPGSFNVKWGMEVWRRVSEAMKDEDNTTNGDEPPEMNIDIPSSRTMIGRSHPALHPPGTPPSSVAESSQGEDVMHELCRRLGFLLETCKNRSLFGSDELWRKRTRACVEATASLVGFTNAELGWFEDAGRLLGDIGKVENTGELMSTGMDHSFVVRWTCLSLMSIRPVLGNSITRSFASTIITDIQWLGGEAGTSDEDAEKNAQKVDDDLDTTLNCLWALFWALLESRDWREITEDEVKETLRHHESQIFHLARINVEANSLVLFDNWAGWLLDHLEESAQGITRQLPGFQNQFSTGPVPFAQILDLFVEPHKFSIIIPPGQVLKSLCSLAPRFRDILEGQNIEKTRETLKSLDAMQKILNRGLAPRLMHQLLWRLRDLSDGGGLGSNVELFFLALQQLLSTSSSGASQSALYIGTFRAITSDWRLYKGCIGTQRIFLHAVASSHGIFTYFAFPTFITDELLVLLGNVLDKQTGSHIDDAVHQLKGRPPWYYEGSPEFRVRALEVISQSQIALPVSPSS